MAAARVDGQAVSGDLHLLSMERSSDGPTDCLDFIHRTSEAPWARAQGLMRRRIGGDGLRREQVQTPSATSRSHCQSRRNVRNWTNRKSLEELEAANWTTTGWNPWVR